MVKISIRTKGRKINSNLVPKNSEVLAQKKLIKQSTEHLNKILEDSDIEKKYFDSIKISLEVNGLGIKAKVSGPMQIQSRLDELFNQ